jgi:hypothetical protein
MLVNVCPVTRLERRTINALRYGQLFHGGGGAVTKKQAEKEWLTTRTTTQ